MCLKLCLSIHVSKCVSRPCITITRPTLHAAHRDSCRYAAVPGPLGSGGGVYVSRNAGLTWSRLGGTTDGPSIGLARLALALRYSGAGTPAAVVPAPHGDTTPLFVTAGDGVWRWERGVWSHAAPLGEGVRCALLLFSLFYFSSFSHLTCSYAPVTVPTP